MEFEATFSNLLMCLVPQFTTAPGSITSENVISAMRFCIQSGSGKGYKRSILKQLSSAVKCARSRFVYEAFAQNIRSCNNHCSYRCMLFY